MDRSKVLAVKAAARKMDYHPSTQTIHALADACLELMDKVDGGAEQRDWAQERRTMDKQVGLGLLDLVEVLHEIIDNVPADLTPAVVEGEPLVRDLNKAVLIAELIDEMVGAKLGWHKEWSFYRPRIAEEYGEE